MGKAEKRVLGAILLGAVTVFALGACGDGRIGPASTADDGQPVPEQITAVRFDVPAGDVRIRVEPGAPVSFRRHLEYHGNKPGASHRVEGGTLVLASCGNNCAVDYDLVVPARLPISGTAAAGAVEVTGARTADVRAAAGKVTLRDVAGEAKVDSAAGDVDLTLSTPAAVKVKAAAGSIVVSVPGGPYRVDSQAMAGRTSVGVPTDPGAANVLDLRSSAGDITVKAA
ncbi:DUF4097 family beta strand repeat-containing protein [Amycolatopsis anabasis]|uniref:DUF4097 family beta strand repeat-containing protein n=1 Tax=Amycolatopsis anabasis TaxID=1840409 RepID=UPI00131C9B16|nr:DUF4097 family beta strand repeat-containing protein [Amycolatopsis anabasis]